MPELDNVGKGNNSKIIKSIEQRIYLSFYYFN